MSRIDQRLSQQTSPCVAKRTRIEVAKEAATNFYAARRAVDGLSTSGDPAVRQPAVIAARELRELWEAFREMEALAKAARNK